MSSHRYAADTNRAPSCGERIRFNSRGSSPGSVFLGDPGRCADGKAVASYVGMIPREYSRGARQRLGGLSKQGNRLLRFLWCEAALYAVRRDASCSGSTGASWHRRDWVKPESLQPANSRSGCGSCCATKSIIQSSVVVASCGRKAVLPVRGCQTWVRVLQSSDCETG